MRAAATGSGSAGLPARGPPQRRLPQDDPLYGAPAQEAIDAFADDVGEMLDLDRRRSFDPQNERAGVARPNADPSPPVSEVAGGDTGRGHWILIGSLCAAISPPTISVQRVTSSAEAKPCRVNVSPTTLPRSSRSGLAKEREGLFINGVLCHPSIMTVAAKTAVRQRAKRPASISFPQPTVLLAWYDRHRRKLPWRVAPGERADPYRVWLSEIMLQQTTVAAVTPYYARFLARWGDVRALAAAPHRGGSQSLGGSWLLRARPQPACLRARRG